MGGFALHLLSYISDEDETISKANNVLYVGRLYGLMMGNGVKLKHLSCNQQHL